MPLIYLIGSLRNPEIPTIGNALRKEGYEVFDDWFAGGPEADDKWQQYENQRGHTYKEAYRGYAAKHVFEFDRFHLERADIGVLIMPAGRSGHLELGFMAGRGKPTYIMFEKEPERYDVMYQFATDVAFGFDDLLNTMKKNNERNNSTTTGSFPQREGDRISPGVLVGWDAIASIKGAGA